MGKFLTVVECTTREKNKLEGLDKTLSSANWAKPCAIFTASTLYLLLVSTDDRVVYWLPVVLVFDYFVVILKVCTGFLFPFSLYNNRVFISCL